MSAIVNDIITELKSICSTVLGAEYQLVPFIFDVSKNDSRRSEKAFGVRSLSGTPSESVTKYYTVDQGFEIVLVDTIARTADDSQREDVIGVMYDKADEIFKEIVNTKINLAVNVLVVNGPELSEPEFYDENKLVVLRVGITAKYRNILN